MASHYDIASLVKCVILIVPANDAHFYKNITGKYKYSEKYKNQKYVLCYFLNIQNEKDFDIIHIFCDF